MKISRGFIVALLFLFVFLVLIEIKMPKKFNWNENTFGSTDSNPYGSQLVDSFLMTSTHGKYEVKSGGIADAYNDSSQHDKTFVFVEQDFDAYICENDTCELKGSEYFLSILKRGQNIIWISSYMPTDTVLQELGLTWDYNTIEFFSPKPGYEISLRWNKDEQYKRTLFIFKTNEYEIVSIDRDYTFDAPRAHNHNIFLLGQDNRPKGISLNYGKGKLIYVTFSDIYHNYNLLQPGGGILLLRILTLAGDAPIVRYDPTLVKEYIEEHERSQSPLRVFLENRSLRWAIYITLIAIVLSLFFTARRRQRVIPVVEEPKNQTLAMVKHIGLMHYRHHDNAGLVRDYFKHFSHELLRKILIDVNEDYTLDDNISLITSRTGLTIQEIKDDIAKLQNIENDYDIKLSDKETKRLIDFMNKILNEI